MMLLAFAVGAQAKKEKQRSAKADKQNIAVTAKKKKENHFAEKVSLLGSVVSVAVVSESMRNTQARR